jgi:hypothetical protein
MAKQNKQTVGGHGGLTWLEFDERLLKAWRIGGANPKTKGQSFRMTLSPSARR